MKYRALYRPGAGFRLSYVYSANLEIDWSFQIATKRAEINEDALAGLRRAMQTRRGFAEQRKDPFAQLRRGNKRISALDFQNSRRCFVVGLVCGYD